MEEEPAELLTGGDLPELVEGQKHFGQGIEFRHHREDRTSRRMLSLKGVNRGVRIYCGRQPSSNRSLGRGIEAGDQNSSRQRYSSSSDHGGCNSLMQCHRRDDHSQER